MRRGQFGHVFTSVVVLISVNPDLIDDMTTAYGRASLGCRISGEGWIDHYFEGKIDDFRYYKFALNANEVTTLYNNGNGTEEKNPVVVGSGSTNPPTPANIYVSNVDYNAAGQITKIVDGSGSTTNYTYDSKTLRLTTMVTTNASSQQLQNFAYTYDGVGNILTITDTVNTGNQTFQYDALNRLTQSIGAYGTKTFSYDPIGNLLTKDGLTYTYGVSGAKPHAVTALSDGTIIQYDANGNMTKKTKGSEVWDYVYDLENRLTCVKKNNSTIANYEYDGDGGRVKKTVYSSTTNTTKYVGSLYEETNGTATKHIYLGDQLIASITGTTKIFNHADHLGGVNVTTDATGVKKELCEYLPFGGFSRHEKYGNTQEVAWFYFTGKKLDDESGLYYYGARYYDPLIGRFITADTIVQDPSNPQTLNRYAYCGNNPVNNIDPTGHSFWKSIKKFFQKFGDFISPFGRAVITGDWANFGWQVLNLATIAIGISTQNPWLIASGVLSYSSRATSHIGGNAADEISRGFGYASMAAAVVGTGIEIGKFFSNATLPNPATAAGGNVDELAGVAYQKLSSGEIGEDQLLNMFHDARSVADLIGQLTVISSVYGFSRELELEADRQGFAMIQKAGYDVKEAPKMFEHLKQFIDDEETKHVYFFSSHPDVVNRIESYNELIKKTVSPEHSADKINTDPYQQLTRRLILDNFKLCLQLGMFMTAERSIKSFIEKNPQSAEAYFNLGELYRQRQDHAKKEKFRDKTNDYPEALKAYEQALQIDENYFSAIQGKARVLQRQGEHSKAKEVFRQYLAVNPQAEDRAYIEQFIAEATEEKK